MTLFVSRCGLFATKNGARTLLRLRLSVLLFQLRLNPILNVWRRALETCRSILFSQHDGDYTLGDRRISWVRRVRNERLIEIIDLEKDRLAIDLERPKVVFFIWIVGVTEIVVQGDGLDNAGDGFSSEGGTPAVINAVPTVRFWRRLSLRARVVSVFVVIVVSWLVGP